MLAPRRIHIAKTSQALTIVVAIIARSFVPLAHDHICAISLRAAGPICLRAVVISLASRVTLHWVRAFTIDAAARGAFKTKVTSIGSHF